MPRENNIPLPFQTSHAFIVGVNDYVHICSLKTAANDAKGMAQRLGTQHAYKIHGPLINPGKDKLTILFNETMPNEVGPNDRLLFYFAGHGIALDGEDGPNGYLVPADARHADMESLIPMKKVYEVMNRLPCKHGIIILDCCFAGAFKWSAGYRDIVFDLPHILYEERFSRYCTESAWQVITSSAYDQKALDVINNQSLGMREQGEHKHSPFALALFKGIDGAADLVPDKQGNGVITASELYIYLRQTIEKQTLGIQSRQTPSLINLPRHDKGEYIFLHPNHRHNLPPRPNRNPFMGLSSYNEKDQEFFYGRNKVIKALEKHVTEHQLVVVSGASGTGKSSVLKAGILPKLRKAGWIILPIIRPGKDPVKVLKKELKDFDKRMIGAGKKLLIIDQYEELITQCLHVAGRFAFENTLATWIRTLKELHIILSVRSDFEPQFEGEALAYWWKKGRFIVPPFSKEEIREIIRKPASQSVLFYEPRSLTDRIEEELNQEPGALPLLSFTLSELYNAYLTSGREDRALTQEDYENLGGIIGSLRTKADEVYDSQEGEYRLSMRRLMLRMVSLEGREAAGKRLYTEELVFKSKEETQRIRDISKELIQARLLVQGRNVEGRSYIEPAHDALVRAWARLWDWIKEVGEEQLIIRKQLWESVQQYNDPKPQTQQDHKYTLNPTQLWDQNPKLEQVLDIWETDPNSFNEAEERFIRKSKITRKNNIEKLKQERDHAIAVALSGKALLRINTDTTQALRIAEMAFSYCDLPPKESEEALIQIFNYQQKEPFYQMIFKGHDKYVNAIALSPNEKWLLTGSTDHSLRVWDLTGKEILKLTGHTGSIEAVGFSPDGTYILSGSVDHKIKIWTQTGELIHTCKEHQKGITSLAFSPDGLYFASGSRDNTLIIWNAKTFKKYKTLQGHTADIHDICFSPDGKYVLSGSLDTSLRLWNLESEEFTLFEGHSNAVLSLDFSSDGQHIISGSSDQTLRLWNRKGELLQTLEGHHALVNSVIFSAKGQEIISACSKGVCIHWNLQGKELIRKKLHHRAITALAYTQEGQLLSASEDNSAILWMKANEMSPTWQHPDLVWDISSSVSFQYPNLSDQEGKTEYLLSGSDDGKVRLWNLYGRELYTLDAHRGPVYSVAFDPSGTYMLSGGRDGKTIVWNPEGQVHKKLLRDENRNENVTKVAFSPDGRTILSAYRDGFMQLWDIEGKKIHALRGHSAGIWHAHFYQKEETLASLGLDHKLILWDIATGKSQEVFTLDQAKSFAISPDEKFWLTGNENHTASLWNQKGEIQQVFGGPRGHIKSVESVAFSPSGKYVITGSMDKSIKIWDLDGQMIQSFEGHGSKIRGMSFSADRRFLFSCGDKQIKQWWLPKKIYEWLQHAPIYGLSQFEKDNYDIKPIRQF